MTDISNKQDIPELSPPDAGRRLAANPDAVLLDVRSRVEFDYVGHPVNAINVPLQDAPDWKTDTEFASKVRQRLQAERPGTPVEQLEIYAICRSGARSMEAARLLVADGFARVSNITEGFEGRLDEKRHRGNLGGWRFHGLPWEQT